MTYRPTVNRMGRRPTLRSVLSAFGLDPGHKRVNGERRLKSLVKKVGEERLERSGNSRSEAKAYAMAMLEESEQGANAYARLRRCLRQFALRSKASSAHLKENYALLKKLSEM